MKNLWKNEKGATAIEYGLIAALIAVAFIVAFSTVEKQLGQDVRHDATQEKFDD